MQLKPSYIVDINNKKIAVQLDIKTYEKITNTLEDYALYQLMQEDKDNQVLSIKEAKEYYKTLSLEK